MLWRFALIVERGFDCVQKKKKKNEAPLNFFAMIGVWCLANIGRVLFAIFRPVDSVNEALTRHKDGEGWFMVGC